MKNKLTNNRVYTIIILVVLMNFLSPIREILSGGVMPSAIQCMEALVTGVLQGITLFYGLLTTEEHKDDESKDEDEPS